jgi:hypothetical protein
MVERLPPRARRLGRDSKLLAKSVLPRELGELLRAEAPLQLTIAPERLGVGDALPIGAGIGRRLEAGRGALLLRLGRRASGHRRGSR